MGACKFCNFNRWYCERWEISLMGFGWKLEILQDVSAGGAGMSMGILGRFAQGVLWCLFFVFFFHY